MPILWTDQQPQPHSEERIRTMNRIYIARREYSIVDVIAWIVIAGFAGAWIGVEVVVHLVR